jgi:hypothetical protein
MLFWKSKKENEWEHGCCIRHVNESGAKFRIVQNGDNHFFPQRWCGEHDGWKMHEHTQYLYASTAEECEKKLREYETEIANANYDPKFIKNIFI